MENSNSKTLYNIWGTSATNAFAVGADGAVLYFNGTKWVPNFIPDAGRLNGIWGCADYQVFIVGEHGLRLFCEDFSIVNAWGGAEAYHLYDVWGTSGMDVYAVGGTIVPQSGKILYYDGSVWTELAVPQTLFGIWGTADKSAIFAVGGDSVPPERSGAVLRSTDSGTTWVPMAIDVPYPLYDVWGTSATNVYAVGGDEDLEGAIFHYDGSAWRLVGTVGHHLNAIWGASSTDIYAVGNGVILKYTPE